MVDAIFRLTVLAVLVLAAVNAVQTAAVMIRLVRHVARRHPGYGLGLWLPIFTSTSDVRDWLAAWRAVLRPEPALVALRADTRQVIGRHIYLMLLSQTWAMAVSTIAPRLV
jgi:type IV secretory pathway protease TraF